MARLMTRPLKSMMSRQSPVGLVVAGVAAQLGFDPGHQPSGLKGLVM